MKIAVTGSHGYIGSVLRKMLYNHAHDVYACDNQMSHWKKSDYRDYCYNAYDCSYDEDLFIDAVCKDGVEVIYHFAATSLVGPDSEDPLLYYWNNVARTTNMIKKLADNGWKGHIVFSSTAAVYASKHTPLVENDLTVPANVYGNSKLMCETVLLEGQKYGIDTTVFRFFNVAGAFHEMGEEHEDTHLISRLCAAALGDNTISIFGNDYSTVDGTCVRDYVDVRDICRAAMYAMYKKLYGVYNLGTNTGTSVKQVVEIFNQLTENNVHTIVGPRRAGDAAFLTADSSLFEATGFNYTYDISDVITSSWDYFRGEYGI